MWRQLAVVTDEHVAESVADVMTAAGALSVSLQDAGHAPLFEPKPGEMPIWRRTEVTGLFPAETALEPLRSHLAERFGTATVEPLEDRVWEREWLQHFKPVRYGRRLWVCPTGFEVREPGAVVVNLDPGLAFGTGSHPTTALCLEWLDGQCLAGNRVIDYGCGSGILAVAALLLGAAQADAVDIDPQALQATRDNAEKNHVEDRLHCFRPGEFEVGPVADLLMANILANPLIELADELSHRVKPGGSLVLSGILGEQAAAVQQAYRSHFSFDPVVERDEWVLLSGRKR